MVKDSLSVEYGKLTKRIVFTDNDHRHAKLVTRLHYDEISQPNFFRLMVTAYISGDERIQNIVNDFKKQSKVKRTKSANLKRAGTKNLQQLALDEESIEDIFDLIAQEHPNL
jgi:hypothetical protein